MHIRGFCGKQNRLEPPPQIKKIWLRARLFFICYGIEEVESERGFAVGANRLPPPTRRLYSIYD
jgi:hypothetical protein